MAAQKAAHKAAPKKGSKLASLKSAIFGATKKKPAPAAPAKSAAAPAKASASAKAAPAHAPGKKEAKPTDKKAHAPAVTAKTAPKKGVPPASAAPAGKQAAHAAKPAPALTKPAKAPGKRGGGKKSKEIIPRERMAGPSIRVMYDANGEAVCREVACEGLATSVGYCRMHYIKNWKKIKRKDVILKEGKLNQYIEELVAKYPDKYIEAIRQDLANDKDFAKVIYDLDLDESSDDFDAEGGESLDAIVGDIKRDFDDEGDSGF